MPSKKEVADSKMEGGSLRPVAAHCGSFYVPNIAHAARIIANFSEMPFLKAKTRYWSWAPGRVLSGFAG